MGFGIGLRCFAVQGFRAWRSGGLDIGIKSSIGVQGSLGFKGFRFLGSRVLGLRCRVQTTQKVSKRVNKTLPNQPTFIPLDQIQSRTRFCQFRNRLLDRFVHQGVSFWRQLWHHFSISFSVLKKYWISMPKLFQNGAEIDAECKPNVEIMLKRIMKNRKSCFLKGGTRSRQSCHELRGFRSLTARARMTTKFIEISCCMLMALKSNPCVYVQ